MTRKCFIIWRTITSNPSVTFIVCTVLVFWLYLIVYMSMLFAKPSDIDFLKARLERANVLNPKKINAREKENNDESKQRNDKNETEQPNEHVSTEGPRWSVEKILLNEAQEKPENDEDVIFTKINSMHNEAKTFMIKEIELLQRVRQTNDTESRRKALAKIANDAKELSVDAQREIIITFFAQSG
ncbi:hypothetical protein Tcan_17595 [Toxocara canis]|uniref:Uncharacterized protein n=1 Tax=Toxocara canis TaxID=6265 RepID=A0A0B2VU34_TOXCA|nr:hypothetical protein Tcan_17595 [Toxocara canis]